MQRLRSSLAIAMILCQFSPTAAAQQPRRIFHPEPPTGTIRSIQDVVFHRAMEGPALAVDVYRPSTGGPAPALVFTTMFWDGDAPPTRSTDDWYNSWARVAAGSGVVGVVADLRGDPGTGTSTTPSRLVAGDLDRLTAHLVEHATEYGIDPQRIVLFAASGAVSSALQAVEVPAQATIKAAVLYYGQSSVEQFRSDIPILWVRAGLDSPQMNAAIDAGVARALRQNAPLRLINYHSGHHGFDGLDDTPTTRAVIAETIAFVKEATAPR